MPAHNEQDYLEAAVTTVVIGLRARRERFEVVVCENGSTDDTAILAGQIAERFPEVRALSCPTADYGRALRTGFLAAKGDIVVNFDVDLIDLGFLDGSLRLRPHLNQFLRHQHQPQNLRPLGNNIPHHLSPLALRIHRPKRHHPTNPRDHEKDRQRVLGTESAWIRVEFVLHAEDNVVRGSQTARALLDQFGRRQHLQRRGARVGPDHVADRRGGRAIVETQRVQKQILGGLREGGRRRRLGGSTEDDRRVAPGQRAEQSVVGVGGWIAQCCSDANEQANRGDLLVSIHRCNPLCSHRRARMGVIASS